MALSTATRKPSCYTIPNWTLDNISFALPHSILIIIKATPKPFRSDLDDLLTWDCSPNGKFSTYSAYTLSINLPTSSPGSPWKWIWKTTTLPRIQTFLWLAAHDRLPTRAVLRARQIIQNDECPLCHSNVETTLHISFMIVLKLHPFGPRYPTLSPTPTLAATPPWIGSRPWYHTTLAILAMFLGP
ncbi:hypothetical protein SO802_010456 [Lithocarpus litseifolius]|uniref:Reverse transcriptase zinc-binding domain-containing protein n=1 Tax=Lithocarpus litseifolius TaxID=425828 RepID=A0AAW2DFG7_9ROSI